MPAKLRTFNVFFFSTNQFIADRVGRSPRSAILMTTYNQRSVRYSLNSEVSLLLALGFGFSVSVIG